jgi:hypothetical protein
MFRAKRELRGVLRGVTGCYVHQKGRRPQVKMEVTYGMKAHSKGQTLPCGYGVLRDVTGCYGVMGVLHSLERSQARADIEMPLGTESGIFLAGCYELDVCRGVGYKPGEIGGKTHAYMTRTLGVKLHSPQRPL